MESLKRFLENPLVDLFISIILITSSVAEGLSLFNQDMSELELRVHHGILIFGIAMLLRSIVEILETVIEAREKSERRKQRSVVAGINDDS